MNVADIGRSIDRGIPDDFVRVYLTCCAHGFSLSCPVYQTLDGLNKQWAKVLAKYRGEFSDEFCHGVSEIWMRLLAQCDVNAPDYEAQLIKAAGITLDNQEKPPPPKKKTTKMDVPNPTLAPKDPLTTPEISPAYRERQLAEAVRLPELARLNSAHQKAFSSKNPQEFLVVHLTYAKHGQPKKVPKSTVPLHIREGWESIIASEFNTIAGDDFLEQLTNDWFYLVNQKGIPLSAEDQAELLIVFLAKARQPQQKPAQKKPSLFKKIFG